MKSYFKSTAIFLAITFLGIACGKSGGGAAANSPLKPLNTQDMERVAALAQSLAQVQNLMGEAQKAKQEFKSSANVAKNGRDDWMEKDCQISETSLGPDVQVGEDLIESTRVEIGGSRCPIAAVMQVRAQQTSEARADGQIEASFKIVNEELVADWDIESFAMTGSFHVVIDQPSEQSVKVQKHLALTNSGVSQKEGAFLYREALSMDVSIGMSMGFNLNLSMLTEQKTTFEFADIKAELRRVAEMRGFEDMLEKYYANNQEVSYDEYHRIMGELSLPVFGDDESDNPPPGNDMPLACQLNFYDLQLVERREVERAIAEGRSVRGHVSGSAQACGRHQNVDVIIGGRLYEASFLYFPDYTQVNVRNLVDNTPAYSFFVMPDEASDFIGELDNYTLRLTCTPVTRCN